MKYYAVKDSQLGYYLSNINCIDFDITDRDSWQFLSNCSSLLLTIPNMYSALERAKSFILACRHTNIEHIVLLGSTGPRKVVYDQLETYIFNCGISYTTIVATPLMNDIFTEQYKNSVLFNYRANTPVPYLDPICLAKTIELTMENTALYNKKIYATGTTQYYIQDVKKELVTAGYAVDKVDNIHTDKLFKTFGLSGDQILMTQLADEYDNNKYPDISDDIYKLFRLSNRSLSTFITEDKYIFTDKR
jgi:hypothetical protein